LERSYSEKFARATSGARPPEAEGGEIARLPFVRRIAGVHPTILRPTIFDGVDVVIYTGTDWPQN